MFYDSFEKIYEEYFDKVYNYIFGQMLNREVSEDLTEDVFVKVLTNLDRFDPARGVKVSTWIFAIAKEHHCRLSEESIRQSRRRNG